MLRFSRLILIVMVLVTSAAVVRGGDDRMSQLAERITSPDEVPVKKTESVAPPVALEAEALAVQASGLEERPLGATKQADNQIVTRPGLLNTGSSWWMNTLTSLGLIIAIVLVGRWAWGRFGGHVAARPSPVVEVLSRTSIAPRNHVLLLRVGSRVLVVSESSGGTRTLANVDDPQEVADLIAAVSSARDSSMSKNFTRMLQGYNGEYDSPTQVTEEGGDDSEFKVDTARNAVTGLLSRVRLMRRQGGAT